MASENDFLLYALLMGIFITFLYDLLRIFRRVVPHGGFLVSLEDLCFWIYCGAEVFLLMYHEGDGNLRWFAVLGALAGMFSYRKLVSPFFVKYASLLLSKCLGILGRVLAFLLKPFRMAARKVGSVTGRAVQRVGNGRKNLCRRLKKKLTFFFRAVKMLL